MLILERRKNEAVIVKVRQDEIVKMLERAACQQSRSTMRILINLCIDELKKEQQVKIVARRQTTTFGIEAPPNMEITREELLKDMEKKWQR